MNFLASLTARGAGLPLAADERTPQPDKLPAETTPLTVAPTEEKLDTRPRESSSNLPDVDRLLADIRDQVLAELSELRPEPRRTDASPVPIEQRRPEEAAPPVRQERDPIAPPEPELKERVVEIIRSEGPAIFRTIENHEISPVQQPPSANPAQTPDGSLRPQPAAEDRHIPPTQAVHVEPSERVPPQPTGRGSIQPNLPEPTIAKAHAQPPLAKPSAPPRTEPPARAPARMGDEPRLRSQPMSERITERQTLLRTSSETNTREIRAALDDIASPQPKERAAEPLPALRPALPLMIARPTQDTARIDLRARTARPASSQPVEVRIGTIEIKAPQPSTTASQVEHAPAQQVPAPEDFNAYRGMRSYSGWWRGV